MNSTRKNDKFQRKKNINWRKNKRTNARLNHNLILLDDCFCLLNTVDVCRHPQRRHSYHRQCLFSLKIKLLYAAAKFVNFQRIEKVFIRASKQEKNLYSSSISSSSYLFILNIRIAFQLEFAYIFCARVCVCVSVVSKRPSWKKTTSDFHFIWKAH